MEMNLAIQNIYKEKFHSIIPAPLKRVFDPEPVDVEPVEFNKPLSSIPKKFKRDVLNFVGYLSSTASRTFRIKGRNIKTGEETDKYIPYIHRWTSTYKKSIIAKLYKLEQALGINYNNLTMITLTTYQRGYDQESCLLKLADARKSLFKLLRYHFGTQNFFWILEPHKTGFPHLHVAYAKVLSQAEQDTITRIWTELYGMGDETHGVKFSLPRASSDGHFQEGTVGRIRGYLLKYLKKGLSDDNLKCKLSPKSLSSNIDRARSMIGLNGQLLFNALLKKHSLRLWGCSREWSRIMKAPKDTNPDWECEEVSQYIESPLTDEEYNDVMKRDSKSDRFRTFVNVIWSKEGGRFPKEMKQWRLLSICPAWCFSGKTVERYDLRGCRYENIGEFVHVFEPVYVSLESA